MHRNSIRSSVRCFSLTTVVIMFFGAVPGLWAQAEKINQEKAKHSLYAGANALIFQIEDMSSVSPFDGLIIAYKRQLSSRSAVAFRFGFDVSDRTKDEIAEDDGTMDYRVLQRKYENESLYLTFTPEYIVYLNQVSDVNLFASAGASVGFGMADQKSLSKSRQDGVLEYRQFETSSESSSVGIARGFGVEWFVKRRISLSAQYRLIAQYKWNNAQARNRSYTDEDDPIPNWEVYDDDYVSFDSSDSKMKLGLTVYF